MAYVNLDFLAQVGQFFSDSIKAAIEFDIRQAGPVIDSSIVMTEPGDIRQDLAVVYHVYYPDGSERWTANPDEAPWLSENGLGRGIVESVVPQLGVIAQQNSVIGIESEQVADFYNRPDYYTDNNDNGSWQYIDGQWTWV